jgi:Helix-turn-helix domain
MTEQAPDPTRHRAGTRRSASLSYSVLVDGAMLRHQMRIRGLTAAEVARRARQRGQCVSEATISHAVNGYRIHPAKLRAIAAVLHDMDPLPGVEVLLQVETASGPADIALA